MRDKYQVEFEKPPLNLSYLNTPHVACEQSYPCYAYTLINISMHISVGVCVCVCSLEMRPMWQWSRDRRQETR